jgi:hypothetical protein
MSAMSDWIEDGLQIRLTVPEESLSVQGPASKLSLVVRSYESVHPGDGLRELLTLKPSVPKENP